MNRVLAADFWFVYRSEVFTAVMGNLHIQVLSNFTYFLGVYISIMPCQRGLPPPSENTAETTCFHSLVLTEF